MKSEALEKEVLTAKDVSGILPEMLYVIVLIQCQETLQSRRLKKIVVSRNGEPVTPKKAIGIVLICLGYQSMSAVFHLLTHQEGDHIKRVMSLHCLK